ncbi:kelch repeat-containing protein [Parvibaculum sp.]|uniref:Kelch repeat-containing protein n=1 Tax=Parvibaculum sp. TaxID=2024848 RepID=UPI00321007A8
MRSSLFSPLVLCRHVAVVATLLGGLGGAAWADGWREGAPMTTARAYAGAALLGEDLYVVGGGGASGPRSLTEVYDTIGDIWRADVALPVGLEQFGMAASGERIYVAGGYAAGGTREAPTLEESAATWVFDRAGGGWRGVAPMPAPRVGLSLVAVGGKLYALGGRGADAGRVFIYDPAEDRWAVAKANMPAPRSGAAIVAQGSEIYVIGGLDGRVATARVDILDTEAGTWRAGPSLPAPRAGHIAAVLGGRIHVTGGESLSPPKTFSDHFVLNGGAWTSAAPLPTPRHAAVAAATNGKLFVIGGSPGAGVFTVFTQSDAVDIYISDK